MKRVSIPLKYLALSLMALVFVFTGVTLVRGYGSGSYGSGGDNSRCIPGEPWTPTSDIGQRHIIMAAEAPADCTLCHHIPSADIGGQLAHVAFASNMAPPDLTGFDHVDMEAPTPCIQCHCDNLFTSKMGNGQHRCHDCHPIGGSQNNFGR